MSDREVRPEDVGAVVTAAVGLVVAVDDREGRGEVYLCIDAADAYRYRCIYSVYILYRCGILKRA